MQSYIRPTKAVFEYCVALMKIRWGRPHLLEGLEVLERIQAYFLTVRPVLPSRVWHRSIRLAVHSYLVK